jgi:hypothetical protein
MNFSFNNKVEVVRATILERRGLEGGEGCAHSNDIAIINR